jgi:hypothetical protein
MFYAIKEKEDKKKRINKKRNVQEHWTKLLTAAIQDCILGILKQPIKNIKAFNNACLCW